MADPSDEAEAAYNEALRARVRALRDERRWSAAEMATALGIGADRYRKYESRSQLPAFLMERFALITNVTIEYLVTGNEAKRARSPEEEAARFGRR